MALLTLLLGAPCGVAAAAGAAPLPLLTIGPNTTAWPPPNPNLSFPVGPNPPAASSLRRRLQPPAPAALQGLRLGDIRAKLHVTAELAEAGAEATAQIYWRRRDPNPGLKAVVVTDAQHRQVASSVVALQPACGVVKFEHSGAGDYFVYYLPHFQTGGGAGVHFHWFNCTSQSRECVLDTGLYTTGPADSCATLDTAASSLVVGLENRPNAIADYDHTPSGESFHGFTKMELIALPSELAPLKGGMNAWMESRENMVRMFDHVPAHWARGGEILSMHGDALVGEYFAWQTGIFANGAPLDSVKVSFSPLTRSGGAPIPASALTCFNLGGNDQHGQPFTKEYSVKEGMVGALWFGADIPADLGAKGTYKGTITVTAAGGHSRTLSLTLDVAVPKSGKPLALHGDADVYKMRRLRWLDSTLGADETVSKPFTNLTVSQPAAGGLKIGVVNKEVTIGNNGLPAQAVVTAHKVRAKKDTTVPFTVLEEPLTFVVSQQARPVPMVVSKPAALTSHTAATATWTSTWSGGGLSLLVTGSMDFDSYLELSVNITATKAVQLDDVSVRLAPTNHTAQMMCGMGTEGSYLHDIGWKWDMSMGNNRLWIGRVESGVYFYPRGSGTHWENPSYSKDYPTIPFIPTSWGGADAANKSSTPYGANVTAGVMTTSSGPRSLKQGETVQFLFDVAFTPSKPLDLSHHWRSRYLQIGYGVPYTTPQAVAAQGVTVATLHQGIGGIHNGSMVNPYINWPFVPDVVNFMEGFTSQAHELGVQVKFYYTIRELTNHAAELFALKAMQGEILTSGDPYTIPQKGFNHAWDAHGGGAYLHEHLVDDYVSCWQQGLPNGQTDASVCDIGTSRWFNYYLEGAFWSVSQAPHMDGIYYDGINFDRRSFRRIRKTLDRAAADKQFAPLIDIHTGDVGAASPSAVSYLSHFPYADSAWNGEGFNWAGDSAYWLTDVSGFIHGIPCDRLGGADSIKGMLFGNYERNSGSAPAIWKLWDDIQIQNTTMIGWWEDDAPVHAVLPPPPPSPPGHKNASCVDSFTETKGEYILAPGGEAGVIGFGGNCGTSKNQQYPKLSVAEAKAACCELKDQCVGFSYMATSAPKSTGCFEKAKAGMKHNSGVIGYEKIGTATGTCSLDDIKATTYVDHGKKALVVVASWSSANCTITLDIDWSALGLSAASAKVSAPAVQGVQTAADHGKGTGSIAITGATNGGVMLLIE